MNDAIAIVLAVLVVVSYGSLLYVALVLFRRSDAIDQYKITRIKELEATVRRRFQETNQPILENVPDETAEKPGVRVRTFKDLQRERNLATLRAAPVVREALEAAAQGLVPASDAQGSRAAS